MTNEQIRILIVDDEPDIIDFLSYNLKSEGYQVFSSTNGEDAIKQAENSHPHLVLLDIMMPGMDGIETCRELRSRNEFSSTLIAFLTARNEDYSQIAGFDMGADDYITKPIKPRVLTKRIKALLRRYADEEQQQHRVELDDLVIDKERYEIEKGGKAFSLPKKEFELLLLLASKPGRVFAREEILSKIWGDEIIVGDRTIDVHIRKLREKLGEELIKTVKGVGYKFDLQ